MKLQQKRACVAVTHLQIPTRTILKIHNINLSTMHGTDMVLLRKLTVKSVKKTKNVVVKGEDFV